MGQEIIFGLSIWFWTVFISFVIALGFKFFLSLIHTIKGD